MSNTILLFFFLSCLVSLPATSSSNETDFLALLAIKSSIDVDQNGALNSWNDSTHFCTWEGIMCSRKHKDRVVTINLSRRGLVGPLSPHIGNLSFLKNISLDYNNFNGYIPQEIGLLRRLELFILHHNNFSGEIPRNLSQCSNLIGLDLRINNLSGMIPSHLGSLSKLKYLYLDQNTLSGHIPQSFGNLTSLVRLFLSLCGLEGEIPESFSKLRSLKSINFSENNLSGSIPNGLFNISTIEYFVVVSNHLQGSIPSSIGFTLPNLKAISLGANSFSGVVPLSLANASFLEAVDFSQNNFTGPMPRLQTLSRLQWFAFDTNPIRDNLDFITSLTNCTNLEHLHVGDINLLTGSLPDSIANLSTKLTNLVIFRSEITGNIPSGIGNLVGLTVLGILDNFLNGPIPSSIGKLHNMHKLYLDNNRFDHELPSSLGNLTSLTELSLKRNNISGSVPYSIGNCTKLQLMDLSNNNLDGLIPLEIMRLSSISIYFNLSYNGFMGSIPSEVGSLINLGALDLSHNRLSGLIPNSLSTCNSLEVLYLGDNSLQGEIPQGLGDSKGLLALDLSRNNLSGQIPSFLGTLQLEALNLSFNRLQGEVPILGVFGNKSSISLDGNQELCGGIPELQLPPCSYQNPPPKKNTSNLLKILLPILVTGGICFILLVCYIVSIYKRKSSRNDPSSQLPSFIGRQYLRLSYGDLLKATDGFSESNLVGAGRFGSVYKGILEDGTSLVAVKVLNLVVKGAFKSFMAECNALRGIRHRNLLKIMSICQSIDFQGNEFKALVFEFMANGSLENWLHGNREQDEEIKSLDTIQKFDVAIDIAQGLEYLHFGTDSTIIHGDLKPSNILLDEDMTAHIGDFGLAKFMSSSSATHESTSSIGIKGTIGYVAPEYGMSDLFSTHGDVYSYGIFLLEMFTNIRPTDHDEFKGHVNLHNFVESVLPDRVMAIVHSCTRLEHNMNNSKIKECMASILSIGVACSVEVPTGRMLMKDVVNELQKIRVDYLAGEWRR